MPALFTGLRRGFVRAAVICALAPPAHAAEHAFELALAGGRVVPARTLRVQKDDTVVVRFTSDQSGEVHLHGYKLAAKVAPGSPGEWRFRAHATGRYRLEWHGEGDKASHHHGPPLATLDVLPQ